MLRLLKWSGSLAVIAGWGLVGSHLTLGLALGFGGNFLWLIAAVQMAEPSIMLVNAACMFVVGRQIVGLL